MIRSQILMPEAVENTARRFGSAQRYYPAYIRRAGKWEPAAFTYNELHSAIERAAKNPEDIPPRSDWLRRLFGWAAGKL